MTYVQTDKGENEVVTVDVVKSWLNIQTSIDNDLIKELINAATDTAEKAMSRDLITATYQNYRPTFFDELTLRRGKFQSLEKIEYLKDDVYTLLAASEYTVKVGGIFGCICNLITPNDMDESCNAVRITFKAGFGDNGSDVPGNIKLAIMSHVAFLYENRGDCSGDGEKSLPATAAATYERCKIINIVGEVPIDTGGYIS